MSFGGRAQAHEKSEHGVKPAGFGGFGQKGTKEAKLKVSDLSGERDARLKDGLANYVANYVVRIHICRAT